MKLGDMMRTEDSEDKADRACVGGYLHVSSVLSHGYKSRHILLKESL